MANEFVGREGGMKRALGNWVVGDRFWDRNAELRLFMEYLEAGANVLITAPRRIGKTSLMREAASRLEAKRICLQVDLERSHSPADAIVELALATKPYMPLWQKATSLFGGMVTKLADKIDSLSVEEVTIKLRSSMTASDWQIRGDRLFEVLAHADQPVIVFLDEVPILVNRLLQGSDFLITEERRQATDAFMSWLREKTIRYQGRVAIVVTGSIGLEPILRLAKLNATLNTFTPLPLGPWQPEVAAAFLLELAHDTGLAMDASTAHRVVKKLGCCIPHHVQVFFENIYQSCKLRGTDEISSTLVDEVYRTRMLGIQGHTALNHLEERLAAVLGPSLYPLALALLTELAVTGSLGAEACVSIAEPYASDGQSSDGALREALGVLEHDGYIARRRNGQYRFESKWVRDWWRARFRFAYAPVFKG